MRTTIEVQPVVLKAIKIIAKRRKLKVKSVADNLLRYAIPHEQMLFGSTKNRDNGK
jgi:hypothetical protein